ncbi:MULTISPECIES: glycerate kinase [unclassified Curtobacterium]|uniref:glycerate kinase n=1 Tax=unclassified Curtobacterium TaxID=257496 RepID=UPI003A808FBC
MRVLVAPDSFKGSLSAADAATAIATGWRTQRPDDDVVEMPQADGGEGTLAAIERSVPGAVRRSVGPVTGPAGLPVAGEWLRLPDGTAVVEMAQMSGITLMPMLDALGATSQGLGEVIAAVLDSGVGRLVVALGGSASTDGGSAALAAIGVRRPPAGGAVLLTDVTNPLLGRDGAAHVFGPQKGASTEQVRALERRLTQFATRIGADPTVPGAGAAGGAAYGLHAWGAGIESGAAAVADLTGLAAQAPTADIIITGEGRYDRQSLHGKVVGHALGYATPLMLIAGSVRHEFSGWSCDLSRLAGSSSDAMRDTTHWLTAAGAAAAKTVLQPAS